MYRRTSGPEKTPPVAWGRRKTQSLALPICSTTRVLSIGWPAIYNSAMRRVLMNFDHRDCWSVHFIEADCRTLIGPKTRYLQFASVDGLRAFVHPLQHRGSSHKFVIPLLRRFRYPAKHSAWMYTVSPRPQEVMKPPDVEKLIAKMDPAVSKIYYDAKHVLETVEDSESEEFLAAARIVKIFWNKVMRQINKPGSDS